MAKRFNPETGQVEEYALDGERGPMGPVGPAGKNGITWHYGKGKPILEVEIGDYYLDTETGDIYVFE